MFETLLLVRRLERVRGCGTSRSEILFQAVLSMELHREFSSQHRLHLCEVMEDDSGVSSAQFEVQRLVRILRSADQDITSIEMQCALDTVNAMVQPPILCSPTIILGEDSMGSAISSSHYPYSEYLYPLLIAPTGPAGAVTLVWIHYSFKVYIYLSIFLSIYLSVYLGAPLSILYTRQHLESVPSHQAWSTAFTQVYTRLCSPVGRCSLSCKQPLPH